MKTSGLVVAFSCVQWGSLGKGCSLIVHLRIGGIVVGEKEEAMCRQMSRDDLIVWQLSVADGQDNILQKLQTDVPQKRKGGSYDLPLVYAYSLLATYPFLACFLVEEFLYGRNL